MEFVLKKKDIDLIQFDLNVDIYGNHKLKINHVFNDDKSKLPLGLNVDNESLINWLRKRHIPKNREFVNQILQSVGLKGNDMIGLIQVGMCLSLNDDYWVVEKGFKGKFSEYNLYENELNKSVALIAYTGTGRNDSIGTLAELTTQGSLRKAWRNKEDGIYLYKGGIHGFANAGNEPYSEFYAYQIAFQMGLDAIPYGLDKWAGEVASTCRCFCDLDTSFYPISTFVKPNDGLEGCINFYKSLSNENYEKFCSMMVFDSIIYNTDRHINNFGIFRDNNTGEIKKMATLFDQGFSMFDEADENQMKNLNTLKEYRELLTPAIGHSFDENAYLFLGQKQKEQVQKLLGFHFVRHPKYNLSEKRLKVMEECIQERVHEILNIDKILEQKKLQEKKNEIKEFSFDELNEKEQKEALSLLELDKNILDVHNSYTLEEFAQFFSFVPLYEQDRIIGIEVIQNVDCIPVKKQNWIIQLKNAKEFLKRKMITKIKN